MQKRFDTSKNREEIAKSLAEIRSKINTKKIRCPEIEITSKNEIAYISGRGILYWSCDIENGALTLKRLFLLCDVILIAALAVVHLILIYLEYMHGFRWKALLLLLAIGIIEFVFFYSVEVVLPRMIVSKFVKKYIL